MSHVVSCGLPELPTPANDTVVDVDSTHEGSTVTFLCADGEETLSIKCMSNGSWTPEPSEINCSVLNPPIRSVIIVQYVQLYTTCTYACNNNYVCRPSVLILH